MEQSPLTQQSRPESFKPKIVHLYEALFAETEDDHEQSEGFWQELFLLNPSPPGLQRILADLSPEDLLHLQHSSHRLLQEAIVRVKDGKDPTDETALDTLTVFLGSVLTKKYTNPSSDTIAIIAGLDDVDSVFADFVATLDGVIRSGRSVQVRKKAITTALTLISGAYQTSLISYFTQRDLFPSLMKFVQETEDPSQTAEPFILLGLLANYNKYEFQNPYQLRLDDFVNDTAIGKIAQGVGCICRSARDRYLAIQNDLPESWSFGNTLGYIGLGALAGRQSTSTAPSNEEAKILFNAQPSPSAAILLATYDFVNSNKLFCFNLVTLSSLDKSEPSPFGSFLSFTSYLFQHAFRSPRASLYGYLTLFILQNLVEDQVLAKRMCTDEGRVAVRLCRQRPPQLPLIKDHRIAALVILDIMVDGINHNLRRKLDTQFFILSIGIMLRLISFLSRSRFRLPYHWSELWRSLLSFLRFLTTYSADIITLSGARQLIDDLVSLIVLALSCGESFLPDTASYDDLFYKIVETGDILIKFRDAYNLSQHASSNSVEILINVSNHYYRLLESEKGKLRNKHLGPRQVSKVIKEGYEGLSIQRKEDLDHWERFREADHKTVLKRIARVAVLDVQSLIREKEN
ncbi:MAG: hypothetical protein Q9157_000025 [Trypethelium eluteriae]